MSDLLKILHIASHELYVGDGALNQVFRERLQALSDRPLAFTLLDAIVQPPQLTAGDVAGFDLVLVGGGGGINNSRRASRTGTELPMSLAEYRAAKPAFAFVALGHNLYGSERFRHGPALTQLLHVVEERGDFFSVRNDGSRARIAEAIGADPARTIEEVPDPGFFIASPSVRPIEAGDRPYALLQIAGQSLWLRLGGGLHRRVLHRAFAFGTRGLAAALADWGMRCWRDHGLDILLAPHVDADVPLAAEVLRLLYARAGAAALHRPFRMGGTPHPLHAKSFFSAYAAAEMIVGMRGHAVICGVGSGRPLIALSTHPKVAGFMRACGLDDWSVPLSSRVADDLTHRTRLLRADGGAAFVAARAKATAGFSAQLDGFLTRVLARARH